MYKELLTISDDASSAMHNLQELVTNHAMEAEWEADPDALPLTDDETQRLKSIAVHFETISANIKDTLG